MGVARPSFPKTLRQFQTDFATEEACQQYLAACRWPDGFMCPRCGHAKAYELASQRRWQCVTCRRQVSLTSGTILHRTKTPLTHWFWAAYLMTTDKRGISALLLQRQLGLSRYETAWMMLHKLRRAMVSTAREPLRGEVAKGAKSAVPLADRAIGNLQQWLIGTYHGVSKGQLQVYLDEFVFRHNHRKTPAAAFQTLLGLGTGRKSTQYEQIRRARDLNHDRLGSAEATG